MDRWEGKVAVVTGASAGIGASIAEELVKAGVVVLGLARRVERFEKLSESLKEAKGKLHARQCDVGKEEDLLDAFKWANSQLGGVDILVNNAGVWANSNIIDDDVKNFRKILDINVLATAVGVREAVASMKRRDVPGHIININSVLGHEFPSPSFPSSVYSASKWAITALTETVRKELAAEGNKKIKITSISPGLVRTEMLEVEGFSNAFFDRAPHLESKDIADAVLHVLGTPPNVQNEADLLIAFEWVRTRFGGIDILVNNAGVVKNSRIIDDEIESFRSILDVNVLATAISIREAVASMKKRRVAGYIININSVFGHQAGTAASSLYTASKWAITALTETVRKELAAEDNNKIEITSLSPGLVRTELMDVAGYTGKVYDVEPYRQAKDIADTVLYLLGTPPKVTELTIRPVNETVF